jgi:hypothetical protein
MDKNTSRLTVYSLGQVQEDTNTAEGRLLDIFQMRKSQLYFERNFYNELYRNIFKIWETHKHIGLDGKAGVGKSWFQIYMLRRLLHENDDRYHFVVHQVESFFFLYHFKTYQAWLLEGSVLYIKRLLDSIKISLYFIEPGSTGVRPLDSTSRSISFVCAGSSQI